MRVGSRVGEAGSLRLRSGQALTGLSARFGMTSPWLSARFEMTSLGGHRLEHLEQPTCKSTQFFVPMNYRRVAKMGQIGRDGCATLAAMTTQTIPEYLEEERQKAADTQLRTEEEAARILPLQHGHHRAAKPSKLELLVPAKAAIKKRKKKKTVAVARKKPPAAGKKTTKIRKRA